MHLLVQVTPKPKHSGIPFQCLRSVLEEHQRQGGEDYSPPHAEEGPAGASDELGAGS